MTNPAEGHTEARRAVLAMIARQCLGVQELSIHDTVDPADPLAVIEIMANLIATRLKADIDDLEGWMQSTFLALACDEDA